MNTTGLNIRKETGLRMKRHFLNIRETTREPLQINRRFIFN